MKIGKRIKLRTEPWGKLYLKDLMDEQWPSAAGVIKRPKGNQREEKYWKKIRLGNKVLWQTLSQAFGMFIITLKIYQNILKAGIPKTKENK